MCILLNAVHWELLLHNLFLRISRVAILSLWYETFDVISYGSWIVTIPSERLTERPLRTGNRSSEEHNLNNSSSIWVFSKSPPFLHLESSVRHRSSVLESQIGIDAVAMRSQENPMPELKTLVELHPVHSKDYRLVILCLVWEYRVIQGFAWDRTLILLTNILAIEIKADVERSTWYILGDLKTSRCKNLIWGVLKFGMLKMMSVSLCRFRIYKTTICTVYASMHSLGVHTSPHDEVETCIMC